MAEEPERSSDELGLALLEAFYPFARLGFDVDAGYVEAVDDGLYDASYFQVRVRWEAFGKVFAGDWIVAASHIRQARARAESQFEFRFIEAWTKWSQQLREV